MEDRVTEMNEVGSKSCAKSTCYCLTILPGSVFVSAGTEQTSLDLFMLMPKKTMNLFQVIFSLCIKMTQLLKLSMAPCYVKGKDASFMKHGGKRLSQSSLSKNTDYQVTSCFIFGSSMSTTLCSVYAVSLNAINLKLPCLNLLFVTS